MLLFTKQIIRHKHEVEIKYFPRYARKPTGGLRLARDIDMDNLDSSIEESISRTKRKIKEYARNNDFDWFVTLTLDPKRYDSFSIDVVYRVVRSFLQKLRRNSKVEPKYILVPEYHADKEKIHIHGYISCDLAVKKTDLHYKGKRVYNLYDWNAGWSTAVRIGKTVDDTLRCSSYITKYVTKDMVVSFNKKRYWSSKNLETSALIKEEIKIVNNINDIWDTNIEHQEIPDLYKVYQKGLYTSITIRDEKIENN